MSLSNSNSLSHANQIFYAANTMGFAASEGLALVLHDGNYIGSFTDSYGNKIDLSIPANSSVNGLYAVTYPDGTVAMGTIPMELSTKVTTANPDGNGQTITYNVELLAAHISGKYTSDRPVPELEIPTADPNVKEVSFQFVDAKTGHLIKAHGTVVGDPVYTITYENTMTGETGTATFVSHTNGMDYYNIPELLDNPSLPSTPSSPIDPPAALTPTNSSKAQALPETGDSQAEVAALDALGLALLTGAMTLGLLKRKKKKEE